MTQALIGRMVFAAIVGFGIAWVVFSRRDEENRAENPDLDMPRYRPLISGYILPLFILLLSILIVFIKGAEEAARITLSLCFTVFLHICIYYLVLIAMLPVFRRHISAWACAILWLLPNYLYIVQYRFMELPEPLLIIHAPGNIAWIAFAVWLAGFAGVLIWKIAAHLRFRSRILKDAEEIQDPNILSLWQDSLMQANIQRPKLRLMVSANLATPLSIGLFRRTIRVVLPDRAYSAEELALIFRHEIVHIGHEDAWTKFFLVFCTAMCWFNPLMWIAMRNSASDLELSCDETVLLDADDETRQRYANLILNEAGDERGFTTCLSTSATAMRYRLKNIIAPRKRRTGSQIVAIAFVVLIMSCGFISLAYGEGTGEQLIYKSEDFRRYTLEEIRVSDTSYECADKNALVAYIGGLKMEEMTGNYTFRTFEPRVTVRFITPEGQLFVNLSDQIVLVQGRQRHYYYLPDGVDWDYLHTLVQQ